jgi:hypothetical protein
MLNSFGRPCRSRISSIIDLRDVRIFVTVAEMGTVSKTALRQRVAEPALSRQISALEQELSLKLSIASCAACC